MLPFWIALQFLSSLPIRLPGMPQPQELGRSLLFYPLVGLLFGLLLWGLNLALAGAPLFAACRVVTDGLGVAQRRLAPGRAGGQRGRLARWLRRSRTHPDHHEGPAQRAIAVVTLGLVLLLKFTALVALIEQHNGAALILAPLIGRASMLALFLTTRYVRAGGLGQALSDHLPRIVGQQVLILSGLACLLIGGFSGGIAVLLATLCFIGLRQLMVRRLGGTTGDTAGALLELLEVAVVVGLAL